VTSSGFGVFGSDGPAQGRDVSRYVCVDLRETDEARITGHAPAASHLRALDGRMRAGALLTLLDNVGGLCGGLAALPDGWVVTTNLAAHIVDASASGPLRIDSHVLRTGRSSVVTAVSIHDEGAAGALLVTGVLTSSILVPEHGPPQWTRPVVLTTLVDDDAPAPPPIPEWLGVSPVDETTVAIDLAAPLRNPWGILHGGVVAMLVDLATEHVTGAMPADVVLHYLAPNRIGPVQASARGLGTRADGDVVRVEVRDVGADRVTAIGVVTARA
jgi:acyl-coenzyme A thioesterase PaaI-like protein